MKNNKLQEIKPVYIQETSYATEDEISLIDLAMVLINRKKLISMILTGFIILGVAAALLTPKTYGYSTSLEIGSQLVSGKIIPFEAPQTLLAKLQHSFVPAVLSENQLSNSAKSNTYKIKASIPKNSVIIILETKGTEEQADLLVTLLQKTSQKAILDHNRIYNSVKENLTPRLTLATNKLNTLNKNKINETEVTTLQNQIDAYSSQLANLRKTREISPPMKSLEPVGTSRKLIVIIAIFAGLFVAILAAFFAEFIGKVREKQNEVVGR